MSSAHYFFRNYDIKQVINLICYMTEYPHTLTSTQKPGSTQQLIVVLVLTSFLVFVLGALFAAMHFRRKHGLTIFGFVMQPALHGEGGFEYRHDGTGESNAYETGGSGEGSTSAMRKSSSGSHLITGPSDVKDQGFSNPSCVLVIVSSICIYSP